MNAVVIFNPPSPFRTEQTRKIGHRLLWQSSLMKNSILLNSKIFTDIITQFFIQQNMIKDSIIWEIMSIKKVYLAYSRNN